MGYREQRRHRRVSMNCVVEISHATFGTKRVRSLDFSDSGIYIELQPDEIPPCGTIVRGQVQGLSGEAPYLDMQVVRVDDGGIGLQFVKPEDKNKLH